MVSIRKRNAVMRSLYNTYKKDFREKINLNLVCEDTKIDFDEVVFICVYLETKKYIKCLFDKENKEYEYKDGLRTVRYKKPVPPAFVTLKEPGISFFETKRDNIINFFTKSIFTPIVVSLITTLLVNWLPRWLPQIQQWVQSNLNF